MNSDLCFLSVAEAAELIRTRKLSPVELTQAHLDRIASLDPELRSLITLTTELALDQARQATQEVKRSRRPAGALHGIPITYKDEIATAGVRTTAASHVLENWIPETDAYVVKRLREAGAVSLGKANMSEFAFTGGLKGDAFVEPPRNPWNISYSAGGSSNGSAVGVAAGLAMASVGSDSGGSIRIPAAFCGVTGLKPTYGMVGRSGVIPFSHSMGHIGPITRTVEDTAIMLEAMAGYDPDDQASSRREVPAYRKRLSGKLRGLKVGRCPTYLEAVGVEADILSALDAAFKILRSLGMEAHDVKIPHLTYSCAAGYNTIMRVEAFQSHFHRLRAHFRSVRTRPEKYSAALRNIARGGFLTARDYWRGQQARSLIAAELREVFREIDILLLPVTPRTPSGGPYAIEGTDPKVNKTSLSHGAAYTVPFNLTGSPALAIPCGFDRVGLPIGLQLVGRPFEEALLLAVGHQYQLVTDWHRRRPPISE